MERQDRRSSARCQDTRKLCKETFQNLKFLVYIDPECLETSLAGLLHRFLPLFFRNEGKCCLNDFLKSCRRLNILALSISLRNLPRDLLRIRLVGIFHKHSGDFFHIHLL